MRKRIVTKIAQLATIIVLGGGTLVFLLSGAGQVVSGEEKAPGVASASSEPQRSEPPGTEAAKAPESASSVDSGHACLVDESALEDLRKQRELFQQKMKELAARESELKARESALDDEFKKLEGLRGDFGKVENARRQENEARVGKLVETFETMSPKAASQVLSTLDESLAVAAMAKISTPKLAKILNVMEPKRSARLTELMAGVVRARDAAVRRQNAASPSEGAAEITPVTDGANKAPKTGTEVRKGGEKT